MVIDPASASVTDDDGKVLFDDVTDRCDVTKIASCYCPNCERGDAETVLFPTRVPYFGEIIVTNLSCSSCHYRNAHVAYGGEIQAYGQRIILHVTRWEDLNRYIVKSDFATVSIPSSPSSSCSSLSTTTTAPFFEIPPETQRGCITTIEGMLRTAAHQLESSQVERAHGGDWENFRRCQTVIRVLRWYTGQAITTLSCVLPDSSDGDDDNDDYEGSPFPFSIIVDDPAGNSIIENPYAPRTDPNLRVEQYERTPSQDMVLGLQPSVQAIRDGWIDDTNLTHKNPCNAAPSTHGALQIGDHMLVTAPHPPMDRHEVICFPTTCPQCARDTQTNMCRIDVPHFQEAIIMSLRCDYCGYRCSEMKSGGAIPTLGRKITVHVQTIRDLHREVLKSDTAGLSLPILDLEMECGSLGGIYTTVEGLIGKVRESLIRANPFPCGDAAVFDESSPNIRHHQPDTNDTDESVACTTSYSKYKALLQKLEDMASGDLMPFTLILTDPMASSFVGPIPRDHNRDKRKDDTDDGDADNCLVIESFERSEEQNELLGLNDMKTEQY